MWLAVASTEVDGAVHALQEWAREELDSSIPDPEVRRRATSVVDLDAESTTCPACSGTVPRGAERCPSCRLRFA
jgi:hypothetical protein